MCNIPPTSCYDQPIMHEMTNLNIPKTHVSKFEIPLFVWLVISWNFPCPTPKPLQVNPPPRDNGLSHEFLRTLSLSHV